MLNLLFLIKDHQDLDHFSPLITALNKKYKIYIKLENTKLENDKRLIDLINNASIVEINRGWNAFLD